MQVSFIPQILSQLPCDPLNWKQILAEESSNNFQPKAFWLSDDLLASDPFYQSDDIFEVNPPQKKNKTPLQM